MSTSTAVSDSNVSSCLLLLVLLTDAAVINRRVAPLGGVEPQRTGGGGRDFTGADARTVRHIPAAGGPEGQQQLRTPSCRLPVPAEGPEAGTRGVQQGARQGGVLPDPHLHGGGVLPRPTSCETTVSPPPDWFLQNTFIDQVFQFNF